MELTLRAGCRGEIITGARLLDFPGKFVDHQRVGVLKSGAAQGKAAPVPISVPGGMHGPATE
jgi:hypothetical protein